MSITRLAVASALLLVLGFPVQAQRFSDWGPAVNVGPPINGPAQDQGPAISKDGLSLFFQSNRPGGYGGIDIYVSQRLSIDAAWETPQNLGPNINTPYNEAAPALSPDEHRLYFTSTAAGGLGGADVYVSRRHNRRDDLGWQPAENLGPNVNSPGQEQQPFLFEDDASGVITLYFASDRPGGPGGLDIYASVLQPDDTFSMAQVVGELSTEATERGVVIRRDGLEVIFPSNRAGSFEDPATGRVGLDDLWVATRASTPDPWSAPVNLGAAVNNEFTDAQPELSFDGTTLYFNSLRPGGSGSFDLWVARRERLQED